MPYIIIGAIVLALLAGLIIYNTLIGKKNAVENSFATIDVQLKQRHDLIPNLIATVKNYMTHERGTLEELTRLRTQALSGSQLGSNERVQVESQISKALSGVMVAVENYPQLKADSAFVNLQRSLNEIEAQISAARRTFNAAVTDYNNAIEMFPSSLFAGMLGYSRKQVFEAAEVERASPDVDKLFKS